MGNESFFIAIWATGIMLFISLFWDDEPINKEKK